MDDELADFAVFYRSHARGVLAYHRRRTASAEMAADLTAETFAAALASRSKFDAARGPAVGWLYGIAARQLAMALRRGAVEQRARRRLGMERLELTDEDLERVDAIARTEWPQVERLLDELPVGQRNAVRARVVDEGDYAVIAATQGISEATARQRVSRGLAALRARVSKEGT